MCAHDEAFGVFGLFLFYFIEILQLLKTFFYVIFSFFLYLDNLENDISGSEQQPSTDVNKEGKKID